MAERKTTSFKLAPKTLELLNGVSMATRYEKSRIIEDALSFYLPILCDVYEAEQRAIEYEAGTAGAVAWDEIKAEYGF